jgi:hypothetical protein
MILHLACCGIIVCADFNVGVLPLFTMNRIQNPFYRRCYQYAVIGFLTLSVGYLLRGQLNQQNPLVTLLLGVFPNLIGSFATPFMLGYLLTLRFPSLHALDRLPVFGLINLFTFAVCILIEQLHVVLDLGQWDPNDILASIIGGLASLAVFALTRRFAIPASAPAEA